MSRKALFTFMTGGWLMMAATLWPSSANAQTNYSAAYPDSTRLTGVVRVLARPKQADVYVDGFFAGLVDDFNGAQQGLPATPGDHAITLYREGYRTITRHVSVTSNATVTLRLKMDRLGQGEVSELPPPALLAAGGR